MTEKREGSQPGPDLLFTPITNKTEQQPQLPDQPAAILWKYVPFSSIGILFFYIADGMILPLNTRLIQYVIDETSALYQAQRKDFLPLLPAVLLLTLCLLVKKARELTEEFLTIHMTNRLRLKYHRILADKLSRIKYEVFEDKEKMNTFSRVTADSAEQAVSYLFRITDILSQTVSAAGVLYLLSTLAVWLVPAAVLLFLLYLRLDYSAVVKEVRQSYDQTQEARKKAYYESLMSSKESAKEMRTDRLQNSILQRWTSLQQKHQKERYQLQLKERVRNHGIVRIISCLESAAVLLLFTFWVYQERMTIGQLVSYRSAINSVLLLAMWSFPKAVSELLRCHVYWKDYAEVLRYPEYDPGTEKTLSLTDESTLIKLLLGLYEPSEGEILLDGIPLRTYSQKQRRKLHSSIHFCFSWLSFRCCPLRQYVWCGENTTLH